VYIVGCFTKHRKALNVNWNYVATYIVISCPDFNARPVHVDFVVDKAAVLQNVTVISTL